MNDLLKLALEAHGGLPRWQEVQQLEVRAAIGGALWAMKGQSGILAQETIIVDTQQQRVIYQPFTAPDKHSIFQPEWTAIETTAGEILAERHHPRGAFAGQVAQTPWDELHVVYFSGYAIWSYLTAPFHLVLPGIKTEELAPWQEAGQTWRRLQVTYPAHLAVHSPVQVLYFDQQGLLQRLDYQADVLGGLPSAQYTSEHRTFGGLVFPTRRRVHPRQSDGSPNLERTGVTIDISDVKLMALVGTT